MQVQLRQCVGCGVRRLLTEFRREAKLCDYCVEMRVRFLVDQELPVIRRVRWFEPREA